MGKARGVRENEDREKHKRHKKKGLREEKDSENETRLTVQSVLYDFGLVHHSPRAVSTLLRDHKEGVCKEREEET